MQLTGLAERVAVVTGAARRGRVAAVDIHEAGLQELARELGPAAPEPRVADLTDPHEVMDLAKRVSRGDRP